MKNNILKIHGEDNVIVALQDLLAGQSIRCDDQEITLTERIPAKHKFATIKIGQGAPIIMYGIIVGKATADIDQGARIKTENTDHATQEYGVQTHKAQWTSPDISQFAGRTFNGYVRADGKVGTQNVWLVIPLVFCENRNVQVLKTALLEALGYAKTEPFKVGTQKLIESFRNGETADQILSQDILGTADTIQTARIFPNVDGIKFLTHEGGCGGTHQDSETLCRLFASYIDHPNVAGATVLSLGCQHAQINLLQKSLHKLNPKFEKPLHFFEQQKSSSERAMIADAVKHTFVGLMEANRIERKPMPLSHLVLGLECGGSDGFSGISANPALGYASDLLVALNGSTVLAEFPELNGVEQELINRCVSPSIAKKFSNLMGAYSAQAEAVGSGFKDNPSPGNIRDGLITDAMKSAGAARKGGTSPVQDVLDYTEVVKRPGLNLLCTPGNDVESTTGLASSGANIIVFTTGLGTPTGNPVTPVIKFSTNTALFNKMNDIIDIDAGSIIFGEDSIETKGIELLEYIIKVASGVAIPHAMRLGQDDFIPWKRGVSL